jgi:pimeloyl-ACP methyl ester carboxylesterase
VLLLHGVAGNARIWQPVATRLRGTLGDTARIIGLDGRDGGQTDHPERGYRAEDFAADLAAVHDSLGRPPLTVVGHSRGGWLATWFAERHPDRVERLVLVDPARLRFASDNAAVAFFDRVRTGLGPFPDAEHALDWARGEDPDAEWTAARIEAFLAGYEVHIDGSLVGRLPPAAVDQLRAAREDGDPVGSLLGAIDCPVLLLVGTRQAAARVEDKLHYAEGICDVRVERIDATHFLHTDAPDRVAELIAEFAG